MQDDEASHIARLEAENGIRQAELAEEIINYFLEPDRPFTLSPSHIKQLQAVAVDGIVANPGQWRSSQVGITKAYMSRPVRILFHFWFRKCAIM